jgi:hypothetical protein
MPLPKLPPLPTTGIIGKVLLMTNPKRKLWLLNLSF